MQKVQELIPHLIGHDFSIRMILLHHDATVVITIACEAGEVDRLLTYSSALCEASWTISKSSQFLVLTSKLILVPINGLILPPGGRRPRPPPIIPISCPARQKNPEVLLTTISPRLPEPAAKGQLA